MTEEEINILTNESVRAIIRKNLHTDSANFALSQKDNNFPAALVSTQLKYLQKARHKLPTYYNQLCIIPPLAYQQASSELAASLKIYEGKSCLDLTMGLGVDAWHFSHHFEEVVALEAQQDLALIGKTNFQLLGRKNIRVHHLSAEKFLNEYQGPPFDLIYVDPARRDSKGRKIHDLQACFPNVIELMPLLTEHGKRILIKASPLFDIQEARNTIGRLSKVSVHSIQNEVKELLLEIDPSVSSSHVPLLEAGIVNSAQLSTYEFEWEFQRSQDFSPSSSPAFLYEPDVAFYKIRQLTQLFTKYFDSLDGYLTDDMGFFLSSKQLKGDFPGRIFQIRDILPYKPKKLRKYLSEKSIREGHVISRNFPYPTTQIRKQLKLKEGGTSYFIGSSYQSENVIFVADRLQ